MESKAAVDLVKYRIRLCIRLTFFLKVRARLTHAIEIFKSREMDPIPQYFHHPVYCYVMAK